MCCWIGWHFHDWIDYNGVAFSIELLEWGRTVGHFGGQKIQVGKWEDFYYIKFNKCISSFQDDLPTF